MTEKRKLPGATSKTAPKHRSNRTTPSSIIFMFVANEKRPVLIAIGRLYSSLSSFIFVQIRVRRATRRRYTAGPFCLFVLLASFLFLSQETLSVRLVGFRMAIHVSRKYDFNRDFAGPTESLATGNVQRLFKDKYTRSRVKLARGAVDGTSSELMLR